MNNRAVIAKTDLIPLAVRATGRDLEAWKLTFEPIKEGEFDDSEMGLTAVKGLYCAVIREQWRLAFGERKNDPFIDIHYARNWFGSSAFQEACDFSGFDPRAVYSLFAKSANGQKWAAGYGL